MKRDKMALDRTYITDGDKCVCATWWPPLFQSGRVRDAAWGSAWVGAPASFQRAIIFLISVSKEFKLTAGKIIPVHQGTVMTVRALAHVREDGHKYWPFVSAAPLMPASFFLHEHRHYTYCQLRLGLCPVAVLHKQ
jgi:hypothetical protein